MILTAITPDPFRPGSTRVLVDGRLAWTVPAGVIGELALKVGAPVRAPAIERLDRAAEEEGAFRSALRLLERRQHGAHELAGKLERRGHSPVAVAATIARLAEQGLVDDRAFARAFVTSHFARGRGALRLRRDLASRGIERAVIDAAIAEASGQDDPLDRARAAARRRARQMRDLPPDVVRRRLLAFLARRGHGGSDARRVVTELLADRRAVS